MQKISVVVCAKNEEHRIKDCLNSIQKNNIDEIILVDGNSTDNTSKIANQYECKVILSKSGSLTADRQIGIDNTRNNYVAMIDADHILNKNDIYDLYRDLCKYNLDIVQSQLETYHKNNILNIAEDQLYNIQHNKPGQKKMIGTAPAIYNKEIFDYIRFDEKITQKMDDTDFIYRLSKLKKYKIGVGETKIKQNHVAQLNEYYKKYLGYGYGDGEFIHKYPFKIFSILNNLIFRYLLFYPIKSLLVLNFFSAPLFFFQGIIRLIGIIKYFFKKIIIRK
jgi:glycosyltransferase involved in cell wall biosynthesis